MSTKNIVPITGRDFSLEQGLAVQTFDIQKWAKVLTPAAQQRLQAQAIYQNKLLPSDACGYDIWRGQDIDEYIQNTLCK